jgi:hypothetical protein
MKNYLTLIILIISFAGCKTIKTVSVKDETTIHERVVTIPVPQDSATIQIQFSVESPKKAVDTNWGWWSLIPDPIPMSRIAISDYSEVKSKNVETSFKLKDNKVSIAFKTTRDTIRVVVTDTLRKKEIPIIITKEKMVEKRLSWLQRSLIYSGIAFYILIILIVLFKILKVWLLKKI